MKLLLLVGPGENQRALAARLHERTPLAHVALVSIPAAKARRKWIRSLVSITFARPLRNAWARLQNGYGAEYPAWPDAPFSQHHGINSASVADLVEELRPDLAIVSGTDLLRAPIIEAIGRTGRVINLHTGVSPYIKGAPNCTNWALALGEFDKIGNTVMWIDTGIDSGPIIATERTPLDGSESLYGLHRKVMDHAHDLLGCAVALHIAGVDLKGIPQKELGEGRLFLTRHWNAAAMAMAVLNFFTCYRPSALLGGDSLRLVALPETQATTRP